MTIEGEMKANLGLFLVLLAACSLTARGEPASRIGASYYYIEGASALVLTAQMDNKGPTSPDGRHHPALTKWDVQWRFRHNMLDGVCQMEKVSVMVGVTPSGRETWLMWIESPMSSPVRSISISCGIASARQLSSSS